MTSALNKIDLSRIKLRLENICKKATRSVSFNPSEVPMTLVEFYISSSLSCLEDLRSSYPLHPEDIRLKDEWALYAYDESARNYKALEGDLLFCSSSVIRIDEKYAFNLIVLPYFLTSMRKFKDNSIDEIRFAEDMNEERNRVLIENKKDLILSSVEPRSLVFIDGPIIGGNISHYIIEMDNELRRKDCVPLYFIKNSDSRLIIDNVQDLQNEFNSDFHWATKCLRENSRSSFFRYTDQNNRANSKVFTYLKPVYGFPQRVEMHSSTYERYRSIVPSIMNLIAYFYIVQGDFYNPQVRPIAVAEKYAREGLRIINIPSLLNRLGFSPTVNQLRFG